MVLIWWSFYIRSCCWKIFSHFPALFIPVQEFSNNTYPLSSLSPVLFSRTLEAYCLEIAVARGADAAVLFSPSQHIARLFGGGLLLPLVDNDDDDASCCGFCRLSGGDGVTVLCVRGGVLMKTALFSKKNIPRA